MAASLIVARDHRRGGDLRLDAARSARGERGPRWRFHQFPGREAEPWNLLAVERGAIRGVPSASSGCARRGRICRRPQYRARPLPPAPRGAPCSPLFSSVDTLGVAIRARSTRHDASRGTRGDADSMARTVSRTPQIHPHPRTRSSTYRDGTSGSTRSFAGLLIPRSWVRVPDGPSRCPF